MFLKKVGLESEGSAILVDGDTAAGVEAPEQLHAIQYRDPSELEQQAQDMLNVELTHIQTPVELEHNGEGDDAESPVDQDDEGDIEDGVEGDDEVEGDDQDDEDDEDDEHEDVADDEDDEEIEEVETDLDALDGVKEIVEEDDELDEETAKAAKVAVEAIAARYGVKTSSIGLEAMFTASSGAERKRIALESIGTTIKEAAKKFWKWIKERFTKLYNWITGKGKTDSKKTAEKAKKADAEFKKAEKEHPQAAADAMHDAAEPIAKDTLDPKQAQQRAREKTERYKKRKEFKAKRVAANAAKAAAAREADAAKKAAFEKQFNEINAYIDSYRNGEPDATARQILEESITSYSVGHKPLQHNGKEYSISATADMLSRLPHAIKEAIETVKDLQSAFRNASDRSKDFATRKKADAALETIVNGTHAISRLTYTIDSHTVVWFDNRVYRHDGRMGGFTSISADLPPAIDVSFAELDKVVSGLTEDELWLDFTEISRDLLKMVPEDFELYNANRYAFTFLTSTFARAIWSHRENIGNMVNLHSTCKLKLAARLREDNQEQPK